MQTVSERLKSEALKALNSSVGDKKGGCTLYSKEGKLYSGFYVKLDDELTIHPVDMALGLALGDGATKFTAAYLCGEAFNSSSLKRLAHFGDLLVNGEKDNKEFRTTLKKLILAVAKAFKPEPALKGGF